MNLEDLYNDVKYGTRTFADKKLMRAFLPRMAGAISGRTQAGIAGNAGITRQGIASRGGIIQQGIDTKGKKDVAGMKEEGATHRTNLTKDASILMRRLMESGANFRQGLVGEQARDKRYEDDRNETRMLRDFPMTGSGDSSNQVYTEESIAALVKEQADAQMAERDRKKKEEALSYRIKDDYLETEMYTPAR